MPDKCSLDYDRNCIGTKRADEVAVEVRALESKLNDFQRSVSDTNSRFGARIGKLEAHKDVQDERLNQFKDSLGDTKHAVSIGQKEQKEAITGLRLEHKESMAEIKRGNKEILDIITPMKHKMEDLDRLTEDVDGLKGKSGETWEHIKKQGLGWAVALILAMLAAALGLSRYM